MRGDGVGVGDVGAVPGGARGGGHATGGDDGGGARRERERGVVGGGRGSERDEGDEQGRDRIGVSDGAWGEPGGGGVHEHDAGGGDGMRGDGVGVGHFSSMFALCWRWFHSKNFVFLRLVNRIVVDELFI